MESSDVSQAIGSGPTLPRAERQTCRSGTMGMDPIGLAISACLSFSFSLQDKPPQALCHP